MFTVNETSNHASELHDPRYNKDQCQRLIAEVKEEPGKTLFILSFVVHTYRCDVLRNAQVQGGNNGNFDVGGGNGGRGGRVNSGGDRLFPSRFPSNSINEGGRGGSGYALDHLLSH